LERIAAQRFDPRSFDQEIGRIDPHSALSIRDSGGGAQERLTEVGRSKSS
jgi:hypothetical protein